MQGFINALATLFEVIFTNVLSPILEEILTFFVNYATNVVWILMSDIVLGLFISVCSVVDFLGSIFNVFAGVAPVYYRAPGASSDFVQLSLLDVLFQMEGITKAFWMVTLFAMGLCIIFTIFKTAKSISDMALENKNPISKVLGDAMKAGITFLMIPFICVLMLQLSTIITQQANAAFDAVNGGNSSIGTILFLSASLDADKETTEPRDMEDATIAYKTENRKDASLDDDVRKPYLDYKGVEQLNEDDGPLLKNYRNFVQVKKDFHSENFNYLSGFISAVLLFMILLAAVLTCVRRIFELLLLYIVSPFFASTIPLDDGVTFAKWRELFIAKFFSGFGMIFSMKFYLMIVPFIASSRLILYDEEGGTYINMILQILLIIGGAWAVFKSQSLILEILNPEAAQSERQSSALVSSAVMATIIAGATIATGGTAGAAASGAAASGMGAAGASGIGAAGASGMGAAGASGMGAAAGSSGMGASAGSSGMRAASSSSSAKRDFLKTAKDLADSRPKKQKDDEETSQE